MRVTLLVIAILLFAGCESEVPLNERSSCFPRGDDALVFSTALNNSELPHHFDTESKCIYYANNLHEKVEKTEREVFGIPPPPGLNMSWEEGNDELEKLLVSNGIKIQKYFHYGIEYIAWSYEDHEKVEELLKMEPWKKEMLKNMREGN